MAKETDVMTVKSLLLCEGEGKGFNATSGGRAVFSDVHDFHLDMEVRHMQEGRKLVVDR